MGSVGKDFTTDVGRRGRNGIVDGCQRLIDVLVVDTLFACNALA